MSFFFKVLKTHADNGKIYSTKLKYLYQFNKL